MEIKPTPAIALYTSRIKAVQRNFRRYIVQSDHPSGAYYNELATIVFRNDGSIYCSDKNFEPTELEAEAIAKEIKEGAFPTSIEAPEATVRSLNVKNQHFKFYNRATGNVIMIQERMDLPDGGKAYIPHTFWSDGEWRKMEPDGPLPFWKPRHPTGARKIMVHEGAKTAAHVQNLVDTKADHPWIEELSEYEHWGMIGGALSPLRTDFAEVRSLSIDLLVYVCDNDIPGVRVPPVFSKAYGKKMRYVRFDDYYPYAWDLADPMPKHYISETGRWIGPRLKNYMRGCTWATQEIKTGERGRPTFRCNPDFASDWYHTSSGLYAHCDRPSKTVPEDEFNSICRPYSDVKDTSNYLKLCDESKVEGLAYLPDEPLLPSFGNQRRLNTYEPGPIKPKEGDPTPFLQFMEHLIPTEHDRNQTLRWCATLMGRPKIRMIYALLMTSPEGTGKSTLANEILAKIVGEDNTSFPGEDTIVDSEFNDWMSHKRLAVCDEIYAGDNFTAANKLKSKITESTIEINKKFQPRYRVENFCHFIAISNDEIPMRISSDADRRWLVPGITKERAPTEFFTNFRHWLQEEDGLSIILHWAQNYGDYVQPGELAPFTERKLALAEDSMSPGMTVMCDVLDQVKEKFNGDTVVFIDSELVKALQMINPSAKERQIHARKVGKFKGYHFGKKRISWGERKVSGHLMSRDPSVVEMTVEQLKESNLRPLDLVKLTQDWESL